MLLCIVLVATVRCGSQSETLSWELVETLIAREFPHVPSVTTNELAAVLRAGHRVVLLDVREQEEFAISHLKDAHWIDSADNATSLVSRLHPNSLVVAYCSVGYRSATMVAELRSRGYVNVVNLEGSIFAWANEGRPIFLDGTLVEEVHPFNEVWSKLLSPNLRYVE